MFLENTINHAKQSGWMEVICGSMFSGKTEELIRRLRRAEMAGQQVEIFKPKLDNRYADEEVVSHNQNKIKSTPVETPDEILLLGSNCDVVGIDEAQFFDESIVRSGRRGNFRIGRDCKIPYRHFVYNRILTL